MKRALALSLLVHGVFLLWAAFKPPRKPLPSDRPIELALIEIFQPERPGPEVAPEPPQPKTPVKPLLAMRPPAPPAPETLVQPEPPRAPPADVPRLGCVHNAGYRQK